MQALAQVWVSEDCSIKYYVCVGGGGGGGVLHVWGVCVGGVCVGGVCGGIVNTRCSVLH